MNKKDQRILALILIGIGAVYLTANIINFNMGRIFWPMVFILVGGILVFRPQLFRLNADLRLGFVRELEMDGNWLVEGGEYMNFVGEFDWDMREADIPVGETSIRISGFVNEVKMHLPKDVGVRLDTSAFVTDVQPFDEEKASYIFNGFHYKSDNYDQAERKIRLHMNCFVADVRLK